MAKAKKKKKKFKAKKELPLPLKQQIKHYDALYELYFDISGNYFKKIPKAKRPSLEYQLMISMGAIEDLHTFYLEIARALEAGE